jgi:dihydrofolate synthase/folylpolyglutamate synthase
MGGRLDSTNVVNPLVTVITNIGLDHTQYLGSTLCEIAGEKAGIIKHGVPVIIGETQEETVPVFNEFSRKLQAWIIYADQQIILHQSHFTRHRPPLLSAEYHSSSNEIYRLNSPLSGKYQLKNLATVLCTLEKVKQAGFSVQKENINSGIRNVIKNTGLKGRWQTLSHRPLTIADIGHNPDGIREVLEQIAITPHQKLHFVIGVVNDKDILAILSKLPKDAIYYFCKANIPRGLDAGELREKAKGFSLQGNVYATVKEALKSAQHVAGVNDLVMVGGSAFVVAEVV